MVDKTTEKVTRTCFAWEVTHDVPRTQKAKAWFEILRIDDGSGTVTTSFIVLVDTRAIKEGGKKQTIRYCTRSVANVLMRIQDLGIEVKGVFYDPALINTPQPWLDRFFEVLASLLESKSKAPCHVGKEELFSMAENAFLKVTEKVEPPTAPPVVGFGGRVKRL